MGLLSDRWLTGCGVEGPVVVMWQAPLSTVNSAASLLVNRKQVGGRIPLSGGHGTCLLHAGLGALLGADLVASLGYIPLPIQRWALIKVLLRNKRKKVPRPSEVLLYCGRTCVAGTVTTIVVPQAAWTSISSSG